jgi:branched-chain amino acid transport system substrate-binding protein
VAGKGLPRRRAAIAGVICALAGGLAGCGPTAAGSSVSGTTLNIDAGAPPSALANNVTQDVLDAEQLASRQLGKVSGFTVNFRVLHGAKVSDIARTAIQDTNAIAYVGEIVPGTSADSIGILNGVQILQVSPTDTAVELTQPSSAVPGSPGIYYEATGSNLHTFARVVPTTALEAKALVAEASTLHVSKLYVVGDGQPYGAALAAAIRSAAGGSVTVVSGPATAAGFSSSGAGALLDAGANPVPAASLLNQVAASDPSAWLLASSALADQSFASSLSPAAQKRFEVSSPGFLGADLTAAGQQFTASFAATYGHQPAPQAIFGYEAVAAVIAVLHRAGKAASDRSTVIHDFFALRGRASVLGTYSIDADGDTNLAPFVISRVRAGTLAPDRFISEQG